MSQSAVLLNLGHQLTSSLFCLCSFLKGKCNYFKFQDAQIVSNFAYSASIEKLDSFCRFFNASYKVLMVNIDIR